MLARSFPAVAVGLALTTGCGAGADCPKIAAGCDFTARGACVQTGPLRESGRWTDDELAAIPAQVEAAIDLGAAYWGVDATEVVRGWTIVLRDEPVMSDGARDLAVCWRDCQIIESVAWRPCVGTYLPHEIGHVLIDDPGHSDPRWQAVPFPGGCEAAFHD